MIALQRLKQLTYLRLSSCPLVYNFPAFQNLKELDLSGDSWVRQEVLIAVSKFPLLMVFHIGHYEHSDVDCKKMLPQNELL